MSDLVIFDRPPRRYLTTTKHTTYWSWNEPVTFQASAVVSGPALVSSIHMSRWHRPRWAILRYAITGGKPFPRTTIKFWCGTTWHTPRRYQSASKVPTGESLCGACEGKAVGAGWAPLGIDPLVHLIYTPKQLSSMRPGLVDPKARRAA